MKYTRFVNIKKGNFKIARIGEKRLIDDNNIDAPRKRARKSRSQIRKSRLISNLIKNANFTSIELSNDINQNAESTLDAELLRHTEGWSNSVPLRSGRIIRQPK